MKKVDMREIEDQGMKTVNKNHRYAKCQKFTKKVQRQ